MVFSIHQMMDVQGDRDARVLLRAARVWAPPPLRALVLYVGYSQKPLPKRSARQGLTPPADAALAPKQARGEQMARDPGPARTEVGGVAASERTHSLLRHQPPTWLVETRVKWVLSNEQSAPRVAKNGGGREGWRPKIWCFFPSSRHNFHSLSTLLGSIFVVFFKAEA